ncbi:HK97 family phage prohead protease [Pseudoroseomonas ludipueritiae]|uniref:HK97 family phage prohead protease n=1 Tax=Pseudoroseomonas ludipueritiae TaxID=198093 RepID=A0ABR7R527_9PROT|nr:HK97 family phage prohead protease [Pseudoroseomonas ludipueritiae]MBC9176772.1 HK97 family phage prohead protease [Pseudoroseomonas ludipueritiae]
MRWGAASRATGAALEVRDGFGGRKTLDFGLEVKEVAADGTFSGYGSVFGVLDSYSDRIAPGAFKASLAEHRSAGTLPALLWQHDQRQPIGVYTSIREDERGLYVEGKLALKTRQGAEAHELLQMKAISGLSIGFATVKSERDEKSGIRTLKQVDLWEVSLVTFPANGAARVSNVKAADRIRLPKEFEAFLREEGGYSHSQARAIASVGFKAAMDLRDEEAGGVSDLMDSLRALQGSLSST